MVLIKPLQDSARHNSTICSKEDNEMISKQQF